MASGLTKLHLYFDKKGKCRWRLIAGNGRTIGASSQGYSTKENCKKNYRQVARELKDVCDFPGIMIVDEARG